MITRSKVMAAGTTAALTIAVLAGCSQPAPTTPDGTAPPEERTLEILTWTYDAESKAWWDRVNGAFEDANPGVTVHMEQSDFGAIIGDFVTQSTAGEVADVVHIPAPVLTVLGWAESGFLAPLGDWLEDTGLGADLHEVQSSMELNGETYGLVFAFNAAMLFYNAGLLEDAGVGVPTTPEDFVDTAAALTGHSGGAGYGFAVTDDESVNFVTEVLAFIVGMEGEYVTNGDWSFAAPKVVAAVDVWREMASNTAPRGTNLSAKRTAFDTGSVGMMLDWPFYYAASIRSASPDVADQVTLAEPPFPVTPLFISQGFGVSAQSDQTDLAKSWLEFAMAEDAQRYYAELEPVIPANQKALSVLGENPATQPILDALDRAELIIPSEFTGMRTNSSEFRTLFTGAFRQLLQTDQDTSEAMQAFDEALRSAGIEP